MQLIRSVHNAKLPICRRLSVRERDLPKRTDVQSSGPQICRLHDSTKQPL